MRLFLERERMTSGLQILALTAVVIAYSSFALLLAVRGGRTLVTLCMALAGLATALSASAELLAQNYAWMPHWIPNLTNALRDGLWLAPVLALLHRTAGSQRAWLALATATGVTVVVHTALSATTASVGWVAGIRIDVTFSGVVLTILGLAAVENLMRNSPAGEIWSIKHFVIALISILVFQTIVRFPEFLTHKQDPTLDLARPFVYLTVVPLLTVSAIRIPSLQLRVHTSRKFVFHTAALISMGVLLQGTAVAALYVRAYGGSNATALAVLLGFAGAVAIVVAAASASVRSRLRTFINENFFSYKYDYRVEWDRFNRSLASQPDQRVADRVLRTLAEALDSTGGILFVRRETWSQFHPVARLTFAGDDKPISDKDPILGTIADPSSTFLELERSDPGDPAAWRLRFAEAWLVVPLHHQSSLVGVAVLSKPRAPRPLDWEDHNLIGLISSQLAVYLVQEEMVEALADARQLADFSKRFAFLVHDLKNATGQLRLLAENTERFGHQAEFRADMVATVRHTVSKLQQILDHLRLDTSQSATPNADAVNVAQLVAKFIESKKRLGLLVTGQVSSVNVQITDPEAFQTVLEHVLANALEASPTGEAVNILVDQRGGQARVSIEDRGTGMTREFIARELFRPLRSTKGRGLGIGAYQAREVMRNLGGDIDVESTVGKGTTVTLLVPSTTEAQGVSTV